MKHYRRGVFVESAGADIAELMMDFLEWLTRQDFGRRCILSVRDVLSWVNFLNAVCERDEDGFMTMGALEDEEEAEWDLRLDTVTAFIHAACLVYVDGLGSGDVTACLRRRVDADTCDVLFAVQEPLRPVQTALCWRAASVCASCSSASAEGGNWTRRCWTR